MIKYWKKFYNKSKKYICLKLSTINPIMTLVKLLELRSGQLENSFFFSWLVCRLPTFICQCIFLIGMEQSKARFNTERNIANLTFICSFVTWSLSFLSIQFCIVSLCFIVNFTETCKFSLFAICFYSGNKVSSSETFQLLWCLNRSSGPNHYCHSIVLHQFSNKFLSKDSVCDNIIWILRLEQDVCVKHRNSQNNGRSPFSTI